MAFMAQTHSNPLYIYMYIPLLFEVRSEGPCFNCKYTRFKFPQPLTRLLDENWHGLTGGFLPSNL